MKILKRMGLFASIMVSAAVIATLHFVSTAQAQNKKPNIILIVSDDTGYGAGNL